MIRGSFTHYLKMRIILFFKTYWQRALSEQVWILLGNLSWDLQVQATEGTRYILTDADAPMNY